MHYSVLGGNGFIGSHLIKHLMAKGIQCDGIARDYDFSQKKNLGHVIYAIGLTADFRQRPMDTVRAHVSALVEILESATFDSFLYLSSTRIYSNSSVTTEDSSVVVNPNNFSDLYNISKLMGESICLAQKNNKIRVARLSNVLGSDFSSENFVISLIKEACNTENLILQTSPHSEKDYIFIDDVVRILQRLSLEGKSRIYNVASGSNITNQQIIDLITENVNCKVDVDINRPLIKFHPISIDRIKREFGYESSDFRKSIIEIIHNYKNRDK